ncbi:MAG: Glu/Leu/Phe/Val dehydrogenase dimerization domain-containing protein [Acidobacteriota bacterium]
MNLWNAPLERWTEALAQTGDRRAYILGSGSQLEFSHDFLAGPAETMAADARDFDAHEGLFFEVGRESSHLFSAFVHRTTRGQSAGGLRFWSYGSFEDLVRDGLRLSRGMGHKNALAGLWWGGGKGIIARRRDVDHRDPEVRRAVYADYGRFVSSLRGLYVTAEDVGTTPADVARLFTTTRHVTCVPPAVGGSGNPSPLTARGVVVAMEAALYHLGRGDLAGKTVAVQGLGNVSSFMVGELLDRGVARVVGTDLDGEVVEEVGRRFADHADRLDLRQTEASDLSILSTACDVLAPNAVGGMLNPRTIPRIRAPLVCGAANNQLEDPERDAVTLAERGILYVPDFLANRMGIVNCANEQYGVFEGDPAIEAHLAKETPDGVFRRTLEVIERAARNERTPADEAVRLADELMVEVHPIWGHRGLQIIRRLVDEEWYRG